MLEVEEELPETIKKLILQLNEKIDNSTTFIGANQTLQEIENNSTILHSLMIDSSTHTLYQVMQLRILYACSDLMGEQDVEAFLTLGGFKNLAQPPV